MGGAARYWGLPAQGCSPAPSKGLNAFAAVPACIEPEQPPCMDTEGQLWAPSAQRSFAVAIFLLIDMSNGPKTPLSPATCICPATGAAAGRRHRPRRLAAGGTEPGAAHKGRAASLTQTPPRRRPADSSVREGRLPRRGRHAAAPTHAPRDPLSRGFPRLPPGDGCT